MLKSTSVTERVRLWQRFNRPFDHHTVTLEFYRKTHLRNVMHPIGPPILNNNSINVSSHYSISFPWNVSLFTNSSLSKRGKNVDLANSVLFKLIFLYCVLLKVYPFDLIFHRQSTSPINQEVPLQYVIQLECNLTNQN